MVGLPSVARGTFDGSNSRAKQRSKLHSVVSAGEYGWVGAGSGTRGMTFNYVTKQHGASVEPYVDGREAERTRTT
ncbi:MAG: hypothetical protein ACXVHB_25495 [Solirubrobacteraceae bacterium]